VFKIPTPKLPYELPINAKLTFNGSVVLEVCLHPTNSKITQELVGISGDRQQVKFRLVNPKNLPESVKVNSRAIAEVTDNQTEVVTKQVLIVTKIIQSQWKDTTSAYGAVLEGVIIQETNQDSLNPSNPFGD
jgi:hypothetical protein